MRLDLSPFRKAVASLDRGLSRALSSPGDEELRDACIQRFEYTFELSWRMLKRQLEREVPVPAEVDAYSFKQFFRIGGERGLVADVEAWFGHRERRNLTPHAYHQGTAEEVFASLPGFARDAADLLARIETRDGE